MHIAHDDSLTCMSKHTSNIFTIIPIVKSKSKPAEEERERNVGS